MIKNFINSILMFLLFMVFSCFPSNEDNLSQNNGRIKLVYVDWIGEVAATNVIKVVLEKMGYSVEILPVTTAIMYQSISSGQADGMVSSWIPTADAFYYEKLKGSFEDLGPNYEGTIQGFVVPSYVKIDTIEDLKGNGELFKNKMIGIDAGAGTMFSVEETLKAYGLEKEYELIDSSEATMLSQLETAIKKGEAILVPLWKPHWAFLRYNIKFLKDYKKVMGNVEKVHTLVRLGLKEDYPDVYYVLNNFYWSEKEVLPLINLNDKNPGFEYENAKKFVENNKTLVASWLPQGYREVFK